MPQVLEGLRWVPRWISQLGAIKGCLDYLKLPVSDAWLYGVTGHAFVINVHDDVCISGPTAWPAEVINRLGRNVGYDAACWNGDQRAEGFAARQQLIWDNARRALDAGTPLYGWELVVPEYYCIYGYDDVGYYYSGADACDGGGPKPWQELGASRIGWAEVCAVTRREPADDRKAVHEALTFALAHAWVPEKYAWPKYHTGLEAFEVWARALEEGRAKARDVAYNAACWQECRAYAAAFMGEARERLGGSAAAALQEGRVRYAAAATELAKVAELFPFHGTDESHVRDPERVREAAAALRAGQRHEADALRAVEDILNQL